MSKAKKNKYSLFRKVFDGSAEYGYGDYTRTDLVDTIEASSLREAQAIAKKKYGIRSLRDSALNSWSIGLAGDRGEGWKSGR